METVRLLVFHGIRDFLSLTAVSDPLYRMADSSNTSTTTPIASPTPTATTDPQGAPFQHMQYARDIVPVWMRCPRPPTHDWLKENVDGPLLQFNCGGIGIVIRNDHGDPVVAAGWSLDHWDSVKVEHQAMLHINCVLQEWMFDMKSIIIEGDNSNVIKLMQDFMDKQCWTMQPQSGAELNWLHLFHNVIFQQNSQEFQWGGPIFVPKGLYVFNAICKLSRMRSVGCSEGTRFRDRQFLVREADILFLLEY
ncbi:hypothetical protein M5K25_014546 [Dendrobium thyrsiflorum]|uniref:RNase H type-1 domain-containing protein n=1 Tax=Dendrobium thyrsiflorum TaxID=117978 RepID=A0ABD0UW24_DENTH